MPFSWTRNQTEEVLALIHDIRPDMRTALQARMRHLQRYGIPRGTNTGKGKAAAYGPAQIVSLAVAFELLQLGLTPEHSCELIREYENLILHDSSQAAAGLTEDYKGGHMLLVVNPSALSPLQKSKPEKLIGRGPANLLSDAFDSPVGGLGGSVAIIDLKWITRAVAEASEQLGFTKSDVVRHDIYDLGTASLGLELPTFKW